MKIIRRSFLELNVTEKTEIDQFVDSHQGLIFHETAFNQIVADSFHTDLTYLMAYEKDSLIGVSPVHSLKNKWLKQSYSNPTQFEIPYGGWVFDESLVSFDELVRNTKIGLNESLRMVSSFFNCGNIQIKKKVFSTALIDLSKEENEIIGKAISQNTRHNIRRASKKGVSICVMNGCDCFLELYASLKTDIKKDILPESRHYIKNIYQKYSMDNQAFIMGAKFEDKIISVVLCIGNKNVVHAYIAGRMPETPKNIYQNELLWWNCILQAKKNGAKYFDLCVIEPERLPQIAQFKMGFSKELVPFYGFSKRSVLFRVINRIQNVFYS